MQEATSLSGILEELREIKQKLTRIEEAIEELIDSTLTPEEERLLKKVKDKISKGDFSDFVPLLKSLMKCWKNELLCISSPKSNKVS